MSSSPVPKLDEIKYLPTVEDAEAFWPQLNRGSGRELVVALDLSLWNLPRLLHSGGWT